MTESKKIMERIQEESQKANEPGALQKINDAILEIQDDKKIVYFETPDREIITHLVDRLDKLRSMQMTAAMISLPDREVPPAIFECENDVWEFVAREDAYLQDQNRLDMTRDTLGEMARRTEDDIHDILSSARIYNLWIPVGEVWVRASNLGQGGRAIEILTEKPQR